MNKKIFVYAPLVAAIAAIGAIAAFYPQALAFNTGYGPSLYPQPNDPPTNMPPVNDTVTNTGNITIVLPNGTQVNGGSGIAVNTDTSNPTVINIFMNGNYSTVVINGRNITSSG